jgi:hypothetical protein
MNVKSIAASCLIATVTAIQLQEELVAAHEGEEGHAAGRPWTNNSVNWCRASNADDHRINAVLRGIEQYGEALPGCIKFTEVPESNGACVTPDAPAIHIKTDQNAGCWSYMGMIRGPG